ncbi:CoA transferase subunit A [Priestia aryabhattai]|uniref:Succinyl-CoA--3-ketoacid-CoA transferase n=2 Tax=Priestia TaxID=2800373 RepID=A0AA86I4G8_PRIMG|nr:MULTISPECIES: CoA transferase subunit A [Priestia]AXI29251.1 succinyl-CoA--3-ketoacid-CoA transferase [Priestia megaterium]KJL03190.1 succinyl-CoA:3-ketoacid-CoA transferase [Priestia aryabhattai B8W22]MBX9966696.1 CoA transferase subunit A [Priestia aryabhattai]MBY0028614.1 CoA transferase subunit A [Priestia aryabhattai]MBZ6487794.1 CoA transferase subunit A [Priestia aryabhattai]
MNKIITREEAVGKITDGARIMVGGFGLVGSPLSLIEAIAKSNLKDLEIISNNLGEPGKGLGVLVQKKQVKKAIGSYFTSNPEVVHAYQKRELQVELIPQGTMSEAIRAGGAGIGGFYTPVSVGTQLAEGKEERVLKGKKYVLQESLHADVALIKAKKADRLGNLIYSKSARNFNPMMATAADIVIAEVEEVVEVGQISPEEIVTPHLYVTYIVVKGEK